MMRAATTITLLLLLTFAGACKQKQESASNTAPAPEATRAAQLSPEQLGELGAQIHRNPDRAQELLSHAGLNEQSFEKAIRNVTENPDASRRYAAAYNKAGA
jgi:hypothetical protein